MPLTEYEWRILILHNITQEKLLAQIAIKLDVPPKEIEGIIDNMQEQSDKIYKDTIWKDKKKHKEDQIEKRNRWRIWK